MGNVVDYEQDGRIGRITLNRPDKSNPFTLETLSELIEAFDKSQTNGDKCVIYSANGRNFTYGADLKYGYELISNPDRAYEALKYLWSWQELTSVMLAHSGIIIVGYHGWIIGGGFEHTLACDLRIAADNVRIMMPELDIGMFFSNGSTKLLSQIVGSGRAKELMIMGGEINADEAFRIGLVNKVCASEALDSVLTEYAQKIVSKDAYVLTMVKKQLNEAYEKTIDDALYKEGRIMVEAAQSSEAKKRIGTFLGTKS